MSQKDNTPPDPVDTYEHILEHEDTDKQALAVGIDRFVKAVGHVVMWANVLLILAIVSQVSMRYLFDLNFPKLDELQWHLYALVTMFGLSYALVTDSHVRVDLLHMKLSRNTQRIIEAIGILFLMMPFLFLMLDQGFDYF
jgi:TRAP-type mannitol/chloroaromatic compound transport system permease small subunit